MKRARWLLKVSPAPGTRGGGSGGVAEGERCGVLRSEVGAEEDSGGCGLRSEVGAEEDSGGCGLRSEVGAEEDSGGCGLRSEVGAEEDSGGCGLRSGLRRSVVGGLRSDVELRWLWKEVAGTL
jgi:hypothetical protein